MCFHNLMVNYMKWTEDSFKEGCEFKDNIPAKMY